ncbi:MAG: helix-turn-helix transcriptional regulator [Proteobacteria bacterium]|nr:helix-turn-helix transcriptional regulator [Pseudomonadota bacterium]
MKTLADHLRKRRLDLKLFQKEVAQIIGADEVTIYNWENNNTTPFLPFIPKIIAFLGYNPADTIVKKTLGEKIKSYRWSLGLTQKELAKRLGIDPTTLGKWERCESKPSKELLEKLNNFLLL